MEKYVNSIFSIEGIIVLIILLITIGIILWIFNVYKSTQNQKARGYLTPKMQKKYRNMYLKGIAEAEK